MRRDNTRQEHPFSYSVALWTALCCFLQRTAVYHHTHQMQGDVVQHNRTDNFVDTTRHLEDCRNESPDSTGECREAETNWHGNPRGLRKNWREFCSEPRRCKCPYQKLSFGTDVPDSTPKCHSNRKPCHQKRRTFHKRFSELAPVAECTTYGCLIGFEWIVMA